MSPRQAAARRTVLRFVHALEIQRALETAALGLVVDLFPSEDDLREERDLWEAACMAGIAGRT